MIEFEIKGLDELQRNLEQLERNLGALEGTREVPLEELFIPAFMAHWTDFGNIQEMVDASGISTPDEIGAPRWDEFVLSRTKFDGWREMIAEAGADYASRRLGF